MKAKGTQKEKGKQKKMTEEETLEFLRSKEAHKMISRAMGHGRYELNIFDLVYCHALDKFVDHEVCRWCHAGIGNYADTWHQQMCDKANDAPPDSIHSRARAWTIEELVKRLEEERKRVRKERTEELEDREKYGPIHKETKEEIREREEFARRLSRVDPLDMLKPFTI